VHEVIRETVRLLQQSVGAGVEIELQLEAADAWGLGDPTQLQNMLLNLGINARDAMPAGGRLVIATRKEDLSASMAAVVGVTPGPYLRISVADTGEGMTPEVRKHLFEPFFTTKPVGKGTGLGLASVHGTVGKHRGAISVESARNVGTTFTIHLPLLSSSLERSGASEATSRGSEPRAGGAPRPRLLLVDDEEGVLQVGAAMLRHLGYDVEACRDGNDAIVRYREARAGIDLVILDLQMPHLGGREVLAAMRAIDPRVKALIASGYSVDDEARDIVTSGAKGFLQKPFTLAQLESAVATALKRGTTRSR
jgi:CheY-like chemotaxis protein